MSDTVGDNYAVYYADKLWNLLPAVYRAEDTAQFNTNGPLRELVNRMGGAAAALRRSIDRLWEDQSIETCDDWVIPYIGALLDTRLVPGLPARGQRLDVANTIDYRRRKGTLAVAERIAADITGWDVKAVEFFRRLGRTRHGLDPAVGPSVLAESDLGRLQRAEGLVGTLTRTGIGGFADLRKVYGAGQSRGAFDEFFHTADTRAGQGVFGWHAIPHLGIFVWRLLSLGVGPVTPVAVTGCPGWYCFDPTGRDVPLFAPARAADAFGDNWVSPSEGQLPGPISQALLDRDIGLGAAGLGLYGAALQVLQARASPPEIELLPTGAGLTLRPERGRFHYGALPAGQGFQASYCYGFPSLIGAGPYDRRGQAVVVETPGPALALSGGGAALAALPGGGTVTLGDSLTYQGAADVAVPVALTINAANKQRPLIRLDPGGAWVITGGGPDACLEMDGIFISGQDVVLRGQFAGVTLTCCTFDPGSAAQAGTGAPFQIAADGRALAPARLLIEAAVTNLLADRCVLGPVRVIDAGTVETATFSNSTIQAIRGAGDEDLPPASPPAETGGNAALRFDDGTLVLSRCTVMGRIVAHRLRASECVLQERAVVDDIQDGCVRFSAWARGSQLPRKYESVCIAPGAPLFTSAVFGAPGYAQLLADVDWQILPAATAGAQPQNSISAGAADGAEMGAYARDKNPVRAEALMLKLQEYLPAGVMPVVIDVT